MPKEFFKIENATSLKSIAPSSKIHIIGVSGVAMAQLAIVLANQGFEVSGSDKDFYEPTGSLLKASKVKILKGYQASNVPSDAALVVIGNAVSYGNEEVEAAERKGLPYTCFPKLLHEVVISDRHSIVVTGTHGKTTTTAIITHMLTSLNLDPGFFIGGLVREQTLSLYNGKGKFSVVEGDEYDSAFFAKLPKFHFYKPNTCIINAIEYDHADIYPDLESIKREFTKLVVSMPAEGTALCCLDCPAIKALLQEWKRRACCKLITFGVDKAADWRLSAREQHGLSQKIEVQSKEVGTLSLSLQIAGRFNAKNALAALATAHVLGLKASDAMKAISSFRSVRRRQEVRLERDGVTLIEDFAHHPTAVFETVTAIREAYPDKKLWAVFEPRSNTSRRKVFQEDYIKAFAAADQIVLCNILAREIDAGQELLSVSELSNSIAASGKQSVALPDATAIKEYLLTNRKKNDVFLVMSNGSFGGLIQMLEDALR